MLSKDIMSQNNQPPLTTTKPNNSILLGPASLAWSQPSIGSPQLVTPSAPPSVVAALVDQPSPISGSFRSNLETASLSSSVSTLNTSELDRNLNTLDRLTVTDTASDSQSVIDNLSTHATIGSAASNDDSSQAPSPGEPAGETNEFTEIEYHWFYQKHADNNDIWEPFSLYDNQSLEYAYQNGLVSTPIPTNGTRFDVNLLERTRKPVYWDGPETRVQRCAWFYKRDSDFRFVPYGEEDAEMLEMNYR